MKSQLYSLIYFIVSVVAVMILLFAVFHLQLSFEPKTSVVICTAGISLLIVSFLIYVSLKSSKDDPFPLGLSTGSIRALVSILVLVFFILLSLIFYYYTSDKDLAKDVVKTLGTLVIAVSAFYFGSKATEEGSKMANQTFNNAARNLANIETDIGVPAAIIELALSTNDNKEKWKKDYQCIDIKVGKKKIQNTTNDLDCLVFIVESKDNRQGMPAIPGTIPFTSNGKTYNIPTDVQLQAEQPVTDVPSAQADASASSEELPVEVDVDKKSEDTE